MQIDSSFHRLDPLDDRSRVTITVDGRNVEARDGENLAAAMLAAGQQWFRLSAGSSKPRGPWCLMGACYECVIEVDGVARQACMTTVSDGMQIARRGQLPELRGVSRPTDADS